MTEERTRELHIGDTDGQSAIARADVRALIPPLAAGDQKPTSPPKDLHDLLALPEPTVVDEPPAAPAPDRDAWVDLANDTALLAAGVHELSVLALACRVPIGELQLTPAAPFQPMVVHSVRDGSEGERRAEVDRVAGLLGVRAVADYPDVELQHATYAAERSFGPVTYRVQTHLDAPPLPAAEEADVDWEAARREYYVEDVAGLEQPRRLPPTIVNPSAAAAGEPMPVDSLSCAGAVNPRRRARGRRGIKARAAR